MKILLVSNMFPNKKNPSYGTFVKKFCEELEKNDICYEKSVMYKASNKISKVIKYSLFYIKTFFKIIFKKYDIIYVHYASHSSTPVILASKFKKINIYTNVHGSDVVPENKQQERFQKNTIKILKISKKIIVPSEYFKSYVTKKYSIISANIFVYPSCGVDTKVFKKVSSDKILEIRKKYNLDSKTTFSFVGRISTNKGWDIFLKAIKVAENNGFNANYILVGSGNEESNLNQLIESLELKNKIKRYPLLTQTDLTDIYNISDAFIFPTMREGESLGLVAIEAMACGTPVIATDFAAPKYYIKNNENGMKFSFGDYDKLADIMIEFIKGNLKKEDFEDGVKRTSKEYDSQKINVKFLEIFAENR